MHTSAPLRENNMCTECCSTFSWWYGGLDLPVRAQTRDVIGSIGSAKCLPSTAQDHSASLCQWFPTCKTEMKFMSRGPASGATSWVGNPGSALPGICPTLQSRAARNFFFSLQVIPASSFTLTMAPSWAWTLEVRMTKSCSKEPKTSAGAQTFLPGAQVFGRGFPPSGKGFVRLRCGGPRWWHQCQSLLLRSKLLSQPSSYGRNHSLQPLQFTVRCHQLNHQRKVTQQTGNCKGRGPGRNLCLSPLLLWNQRLVASPPQKDLAPFACQSPKQLAGVHAGTVSAQIVVQGVGFGSPEAQVKTPPQD